MDFFMKYADVLFSVVLRISAGDAENWNRVWVRYGLLFWHKFGTVCCLFVVVVVFFCFVFCCCFFFFFFFFLCVFCFVFFFFVFFFVCMLLLFFFFFTRIYLQHIARPVESDRPINIVIVRPSVLSSIYECMVITLQPLGIDVCNFKI